MLEVQQSKMKAYLFAVNIMPWLSANWCLKQIHRSTTHSYLSAGCWAAQRYPQSPQGWQPGTHTGPHHELPPEWCGEYQKTGQYDDGPKVTGFLHASMQWLAEGTHLPRRRNPLCDPRGPTDPVEWLWTGGLLWEEQKKREQINCWSFKLRCKIIRQQKWQH